MRRTRRVHSFVQASERERTSANSSPEYARAYACKCHAIKCVLLVAASRAGARTQISRVALDGTAGAAACAANDNNKTYAPQAAAQVGAWVEQRDTQIDFDDDETGARERELLLRHLVARSIL